MTPTFIADAVQVIKERYGDGQVQTTLDAGRTLLRIAEVELYNGCAPRSTPMLLVLDPRKSQPQAYVQSGQLLSNGKAPRSTSSVTVAGESWLQFSFRIPWSEEHGIGRFIAAARQRFAQDE